MKSKQLLILIGILGVLIFGALFVMKRDASRHSSSGNLRGQPLFEDFQFNDVQQMQVKSLEEEVNLVRKDDQWVVTDRDDFPADFGRLNGLFLRLLDTKILQSMEAGESRSGQMKLVRPAEGVDEEEAAILLSLQDGEGKELRHLLIGKSVYNSGDPAAPNSPGGKTSRYLRSSANPDLVLEVGNNFDNANAWPFGFDSINAKPGEWLDKSNFIKIEKIESISVTFPDEGKQGYTLTRETATGDFTLADPAEGEELDPAKVSSLKTLLGTASFEDVLTNTEEEALDLTQGSQVTITTFEGFTYNLTVGPNEEEATTIPVKFEVTADLPEERVIEEGNEETEEEKALADKTHEDNLTKWREKLEREKQAEGRFYELSSYRLEPLLRPRSDILKAEDANVDEAGDNAGQQSAVSPPVAVPPAPQDTREPVIPPGLETESQIEAVTPPVEMPPLPEIDDQETPSEGEPSPQTEEPAAEEQPDPATEEEPAPATEEEPAPAAEEEPAPAAEEEPAPATEEEPAPANEEEPAPATEEEPAPATEEEPAPATEEEPTPATEEEPAPATEEEPAPATEEEPAPAAEEEPTPANEEEPAPANEEDTDTAEDQD